MWLVFPFYFTDCGDPSSRAGFTVEANPPSTIEGATATVECAAGYAEVSGTPQAISCQANGDWTTPTGCIIKGN